MASETLSVSLVRQNECTELFPGKGYCHKLQTSGMEMVEVLFQTNVMVKQEMKNGVKKVRQNIETAEVFNKVISECYI